MVPRYPRLRLSRIKVSPASLSISKHVSVLCSLMLLIGSLGVIAQEHTKPNVILILADDLGYYDVSYQNRNVDHSETKLQTPNIDAIADQGVSFSAGYVSAAVCAPTRSGLLTGTYQQAFGAEDNAGPFRSGPDVLVGIPENRPTIAELFKELGYTTGMVGKWHVGGEESDEFFPTRKGFDSFFGFLGGASNYFPRENGSHFRNESRVADVEGYLTDVYGQEAVQFIGDNSNNPFFLYLAFNAVHGPKQAPDSLRNLFSGISDPNRRTLAAMNYSMDKNIGLVLNKLEELNLMSNTIIVFLSDNGGKYDDNYSYNYPLRGEKGEYWEGGIRIPFAIRWSGHLPAGQVYEQPVSSIDILPTVLKAAGGAIPEDTYGVDLMPFINGANDQSPHNFLYWRLNNNWAIRNDQYKLVRQSGNTHLFDIVNDPLEETNSYSDPEYSDALAELTAAYDSWSSNMQAKQWGWSTSVGSSVKHSDEDFERTINTPLVTTLGSGVAAAIVDNPLKSAANPTDRVLKVSRSEISPSRLGVRFSGYHYQRRYRYMILKVLKPTISTVEARLSGDLDVTFSSMNEQTLTNEWQTIYFDLADYTTRKIVKSMTIYPDSFNEQANEFYIDEIDFTDEAPSFPEQPVLSISNSATHSNLLFPNPIEKEVTLELESATGRAFITIADYTGRIVYSGSFDNRPSITIDLSFLNRGGYIFQVMADQQLHSYKVFKK